MSIKQRLIKCHAAAQAPAEVMANLFEGQFSPMEIASKLVDMLDINDIMSTVCRYVWDEEKLDEIMNIFDVKLYAEDDETPQRLYREQHPDMDEEDLEDVYSNWTEDIGRAFSHLDGTDVATVWHEELWWDQFKPYVKNLTKENVAKALAIAIPAIEDQESFREVLMDYLG